MNNDGYGLRDVIQRGSGRCAESADEAHVYLHVQLHGCQHEARDGCQRNDGADARNVLFLARSSHSLPLEQQAVPPPILTTWKSFLSRAPVPYGTKVKSCV